MSRSTQSLWSSLESGAVPEAVPLLSRVKSPQQITGALAKLLLATGGARLRTTDSEGAAALGVGDVYHCAIMPCFDKKLEASRRDLSWASSGEALLDCVLGEEGRGASGAAGATRPHLASADELVREVDSVITAVEIIDLLGSGELGDLGASQGGPVTGSAIDLATFPLDAAAYQQRGLLYAEGGVDAGFAETASAGTAPLLEDLLSSLAPGGGAFCGAAPGDCESDGHLSFLFRHVARTLGGDTDGGRGVRLAAPAAPSRRRAAHDAPTAQASLHAPLSLAALLADPAAPLPLVAGRNADLREITLIVPRRALWALARAPAGAGGAGAARAGTSADDDLTLVFAAAYGFRNIQGVVARLRRAGSGAALAAQRGESISITASAPFAYVEVMACPSGCANGGGLARGNAEAARAEKDRDRGQGGRGGGESGGGGPPQTAVDAQRARVRLVAELAGGARRWAAPAPATTVARLLQACPLLARARSAQGGAGWRWLLRTRFHALPPMEDGLMARW